MVSRESGFERSDGVPPKENLPSTESCTCNAIRAMLLEQHSHKKNSAKVPTSLKSEEE